MSIKIICCLVSIAFISNSAFAEYYLVYPGLPCAQCYKYNFKKIKYHRVSYHKKSRHHNCTKPQYVVQRAPMRHHYGLWIPAYWENGYWMPAHQIKHVSRTRSYYRIHQVREEDYNLDLTTGDDNPYADPGMNIDN